MSNYLRQIYQATRMVKKYGQKVQWIKPAVTVADASKPWKTTAADPTSNDVYIVFLRNAGFSKELWRLAKGTDVPTGTLAGLMASVTFNPELTDIVDKNGTKLKIASLDPVAPDGTVILWKIVFE